MKHKKGVFKEGVDLFDHNDIYNEKIAPLISEIKKICVMNDIPFLTACAPVNDNNGTVYYHDGLFTGSMGLKLYDDRFKRYLMVINGAKLAPMGDQFDEDAEIFQDVMAAMSSEDFEEDDEAEMKEISDEELKTIILGENIEYMGDLEFT